MQHTCFATHNMHQPRHSLIDPQAAHHRIGFYGAFSADRSRELTHCSFFLRPAATVVGAAVIVVPMALIPALLAPLPAVAAVAVPAQLPAALLVSALLELSHTRHSALPDWAVRTCPPLRCAQTCTHMHSPARASAVRLIPPLRYPTRHDIMRHGIQLCSRASCTPAMSVAISSLVLGEYYGEYCEYSVPSRGARYPNRPAVAQSTLR